MKPNDNVRMQVCHDHQALLLPKIYVFVCFCNNIFEFLLINFKVLYKGDVLQFFKECYGLPVLQVVLKWKRKYIYHT